MSLAIDLGDGIVVEVQKKEKSKSGPTKYSAPIVAVTSVPVALAISVCPVVCSGCQGTHRDHRGIFLEKKLSNGVRAWTRISSRELPAYQSLPRRVDFAPTEVIPACEDCFMIDRLFQKLVAEAQVEAEPPQVSAPLPILVELDPLIEPASVPRIVREEEGE